MSMGLLLVIYKDTAHVKRSHGYVVLAKVYNGHVDWMVLFAKFEFVFSFIIGFYVGKEYRYVICAHKIFWKVYWDCLSWTLNNLWIFIHKVIIFKKVWYPYQVINLFFIYHVDQIRECENFYYMIHMITHLFK